MSNEKHDQLYFSSKGEMNCFKNQLLHGIYLSIWGFFKYLSFPFFNYLRYAVLKIFSSTIYATYISDGITIMFPWRIRIGKNSSLNQGCILDGYGGIDIGQGVRISSYVTINTADHNFTDSSMPIMDQGYICGKVCIEDDVWIGAHVCINKGVRIGRGSVIGSGSVVTKDIPAYSVAVGNPCRVIRTRI